jgi:hypothetical protein
MYDSCPFFFLRSIIVDGKAREILTSHVLCSILQSDEEKLARMSATAKSLGRAKATFGIAEDLVHMIQTA